MIVLTPFKPVLERLSFFSFDSRGQINNSSPAAGRYVLF